MKFLIARFNHETNTFSPVPTPLSDVHPDEDINVMAMVLVPVIIPGRARRINITIDESLLEEIDAATSNRSGFLADAARVELSRLRTHADH